MRFLLIGCGLLVRELSDAIIHSPHLIDVKFLPAGLHNSGAQAMRQQLQQEIDSTDCSHYDAILLGYALCGTGSAGLTAPDIPLIAPRAHDCITLLMGSREKYAEYFKANSGVYFRSVSWTERAAQTHEQLSASGLIQDRDQLIARYGEEAGQYLYEEATRYQRSYRKLTYIRTGLEFEDTFAAQAQAEATEKQWSYEEFSGSLTLFRRLLLENWNSDFLIVPPHHRIAATYDEKIIRAEAPGEANQAPHCSPE
jgi:hypothetical protein